MIIVTAFLITMSHSLNELIFNNLINSLVLMDDVTENIEALEEFVQSVTVASMNKIS